MRRSDVRDRALFLLDEDTSNPVYWTTAEINELIDEALEIISEEVRYIKKTGYVPLREGTMFYNTLAIDPLCLSPTRVWLMDNETPLEFTTIGSLSRFENRWMEHSGEYPHHWFPVDHTTFGIYPRMTESNGEVLRVDYYAWAEGIPDDDQWLPYDEATLDLIIDYVVYSGLMKRWDIARASDVFSDFVSRFFDTVHKKEVRRFNQALIQRLGGGYEGNSRYPY